LALAALVSMLAFRASAATTEWAGTASGAWIRLFADGQKATGTVRASLPQGLAEAELSGAGAGSRYRGTLQGVLRMREKAIPLSGTWEAVAAAGGRIRLQVQGGQAARSFQVPLTAAAQFSALQCTSARGLVQRTPKGSSAAVALKSGDALKLGDKIRTGTNSAAIVVLGDRSVVLLQQQTRIEVPDLPENQGGISNTRVSTGKVWFAVQKTQAQSRFEVETDEAIAAVRGTEFLVEVNEEGDLALTTAEGEVEASDLERTAPAVSITEGQQWQLPPRRRGPRRILPPRQVNLKEVLARWSGMLDDADRAWPFRRAGKARFWQERLRRPGGMPGPGGPGGPRPPGSGAVPEGGRGFGGKRGPGADTDGSPGAPPAGKRGGPRRRGLPGGD
jgi:hypothetical protein